jgi:hypothetical protein
MRYANYTFKFAPEGHPYPGLRARVILRNPHCSWEYIRYPNHTFRFDPESHPYPGSSPSVTLRFLRSSCVYIRYPNLTFRFDPESHPYPELRPGLFLASFVLPGNISGIRITLSDLILRVTLILD